MPVPLRSLLMLACLAGSATCLLGQDEAPAGPATVASREAAAAPPREVLTPEEKEKRRKAQAALSAVAGIAVVGVAGVAAIVLWGGRLRRMLRNSPGPKPLKNELWFLKPEKPPVRPSLPERNEGPPSAGGASGT